MRTRIRFIVAISSLMIACCVSASDTTTSFNLGVFPINFDLGARCDINISNSVHEELLSGAKDTYFATAYNNSIYFAIVHFNDTNFDIIPYLGAEEITKDLLTFGANADSINISPITINGKPGVIGSAFIPVPADNQTKYQPRGHQKVLLIGVVPSHVQVSERCIPCSSESHDTQLYAGYIHGNNSTEYQARFPLTQNDFAIVGTGGNETKIRSLLRNISIVIPPVKKSNCEPFNFGIGDFAGVEGKICTNGMFTYKKKILGIETQGKTVDLSKGKFCFSERHHAFGGNESDCFDFEENGACLYYIHSINGEIDVKTKLLCLK